VLANGTKVISLPTEAIVVSLGFKQVGQIDLSGRHVLITGAASGIGAACARAASARGATLTLADKDEIPLAEVASALPYATPCVLDISRDDEVNRLCTRLEPVDALIHCAGVLQRPLPPHQLSMREWDLVNSVNWRAAYLLAATIGTAMSRRRSGSIVFIASVAGMRAAPLHSYGPAKAALIALTAGLAAEWGPTGVRVNAVSPGFTQTAALNRGIEKQVLNTNAMTSSTALGRLLAPEEVAAAAIFLVSDLASGITGINLPVDAGYLCATPWSAYGGLRDVSPV
jgi:NAD(P)-dependent dehydrogenase (short-subunit alcohol dehydrogenase family)